MTDYSTPESLLKLPLRKFEHFRVSTYDAPPTPLHEQQQLVGLEGCSPARQAPMSACEVCQKNASRYTCPRCDLPYCSVKCYQDHRSSPAQKSQSQYSSCTEAFYHDRVADVLQLEQKAKTQDTHSMIHRAYKNNHQNNILTNQISSIQEDGNNEDDDLSEEDLAQLLELLTLLEQKDQHHGNDDTDTDQQQQQQQQQLASLLAKSPKLKAAFEASLEKGEIQQLVLKPWNPWWRPILTSNANKNKNANTVTFQDQEENDNDCLQDQHSYLDERLLNVPSLEKLHGPRGKKPLPDLTYNLLEVLYRIAYTLRLYHGRDNATADGETALDATMTLLQSSTVLYQDARYESLEEVMLDIVGVGTNNTNNNKYTSSTPGKDEHQKSDGIISWTTVAQDVAYLVANPRLVSRALLEALDIMKAAIAYLKKQQQVQAHKDEPTGDSGISDLRRKRKKMDFFLSWSQHPETSNIPASLPEDIRGWVEHWKAPEGNGRVDNDDALEALLLPTTLNSQKRTAASKRPAHSDSPPPLMQEVRSTNTSRKIQILED